MERVVSESRWHHTVELQQQKNGRVQLQRSYEYDGRLFQKAVATAVAARTQTRGANGNMMVDFFDGNEESRVVLTRSAEHGVVRGAQTFDVHRADHNQVLTTSRK